MRITSNNSRWVLILVMLIVLGSAVLAACGTPSRAPEQPKTERYIEFGQATPRAAMALRDGVPGVDTIPPLIPSFDPQYSSGARFPLVMICNMTYMATLRPTSSTWNWQEFDKCFEEAAKYDVTWPDGSVTKQKVILQVPSQFIAYGGAGTWNNPYSTVYFAPWMNAWKLYFIAPSSGAYYNTMKYGNTTFYDMLVEVVEAAAERYGDNEQLLAVRVNTGYEEESTPNSPQTTADNNSPTAFYTAEQTAAEVTVGYGCSEYIAFWQGLGEETYDAFPNVPVILPASVRPCAGSGYDHFESLIRNKFALANPTVSPGLSMHSNTGDRLDAKESSSSVFQNFMALSAGDFVNSIGKPVLFEAAESAEGGYLSSNYAFDKYQYLHWMLLACIGAGGDYCVTNPTFNDFRTWLDWRTLRRASEDGLYIAFRDREYPTHDSWYTSSGYYDDYSRNGVVQTPTVYPQVCTQSMGPLGIDWEATVEARAATQCAAYGNDCINPIPCAYAVPLPTPKATLQAAPGTDWTAMVNMMQRVYNRQARVILPTLAMPIKVEPQYRLFGESRIVSVTLSYMDIGTHTLRVHMANDGGETTHDVVLANSGIWKEDTWGATLRYSNTLTGEAYLRLENLSATEKVFVHDIYTSPGIPTDATDTPTPSVTPSKTPSLTPSMTPSWTPTKTATPTPSKTSTPSITPTPTPSPTPTKTATPTGTVVVQALNSAAAETTSLSAYWPNGNFNNAYVEYATWYNGTSGGEVLLRFRDMYAPIGTVGIVSATLTLDTAIAWRQNSITTTVPLELVAISGEWDARTATWSTARTVDTTYLFTATVSSKAPVVFNVLPIVGAWIYQAAENNGLLLRINDATCVDSCAMGIGVFGDLAEYPDRVPMLQIGFVYGD